MIKETTTVTTTKDIYIAIDGTEFESEKDCHDYENGNSALIGVLERNRKLLETALGQMVQQQKENNTDYEDAHFTADNILCDTLKALGFGELVDAFDGVGKYYG